MQESMISYLNDLYNEKQGLLELQYYLSDGYEKFIEGFYIRFKDGKKLLNLPLSARVKIRKILLDEIAGMVKNIDAEIREI